MAVLFVFHLVVFAISYVFAWLVRFEFDIPAEWADVVQSSLPYVVAVQLITGGIFGFYRGWWRYVGVAEVVRLVFGMSVALTALVAGWYVGTYFGLEARYAKPPRGVLLIDWAFALLTLFGARVAIRIGRDRFRSDAAGLPARSVLVVSSTTHAGTEAWTIHRDGSLSRAPSPGLDLDDSWISACADVDGDGHVDAIYRSFSGQDSIWILDGLQRKVTLFLPGGFERELLGAADFKRDGKADLLWYNFETGELLLWSMSGFSPPTVERWQPRAP